MSRYHTARLLIEAAEISVPTIKLEKVWHVGAEPTPNTKTRPANSFEGAGLSVSNAPEEWRSIARLGDDTPVWELRRKDGRPGVFVDHRAMTDEQRSRIISKAVADGMLDPARIYRAWIVCNETQDSLEEGEIEKDEIEDEDWEYTDFTDEKEAYSWIEGRKWGARVEAVDGHNPTQEFQEYWGQHFTMPLHAGHSTEAQAIIRELDTTGEYDGIWWNEELDPDILSAPRGSIFQDKLNEWEAIEVTTVT